MTKAPLQVNEAQKRAVEEMARFIVRFGLTVPTLMALESMRPLSFVGSQFMHVMGPTAGALLPFLQWDEMARLLEDRRGIEYVIAAIEQENKNRHSTPAAVKEQS